MSSRAVGCRSPIPRRLEDTPAFEHHPGRDGRRRVRASDRSSATAGTTASGIEPLFPFGFGLGYTDVSITAARALDPFTVEVDLSNASAHEGVAVVQVYAHRDAHEGARDDPDQRLAGFVKTAVPVEGSTTIVIELDRRTYQTWDVGTHEWIEVPGIYELRVGLSSHAITERLLQHR